MSVLELVDPDFRSGSINPSTIFDKFVDVYTTTEAAIKNAKVAWMGLWIQYAAEKT